MRSKRETLQLFIGCFWCKFIFAVFILFIATVSAFGSYAVWIFLLITAIIILQYLYYIFFAKTRFNQYTQMLEKKAKSTLSLDDNTQFFILTKKGESCTCHLPKSTRYTYKINFVFLEDSYITIAKSCPEFNMFKLAKHDIKKIFKVKDVCSENKEYRYIYIQSVHYESESKELQLVLTSGFIEKIECEKADADKAIVKIREKLRESPRCVQTNIWND